MRRLAAAFGRFGLLGAASFSINVGLTAGLHELGGVREEYAYAISLVVVLATNFVACRYWVFRGSHGGVVTQGLAFLASSFAFRGVEYVAFLLLHTIGGLHYLVTIFLVTGFSTVAKFVHYRFIVFRTVPADPPARPSPQGGPNGGSTRV